MSTWWLCTSLKVGEKGKRSFRKWELCETADPGCSRPFAAVSKPWPWPTETPLGSSTAILTEGLHEAPKRPSTENCCTVLHGAKLCSRFFSTWPVFVAIKAASEPLSICNASDLATDLNSCLYPSPPCPHLSKQISVADEGELCLRGAWISPTGTGEQSSNVPFCHLDSNRPSCHETTGANISQTTSSSHMSF